MGRLHGKLHEVSGVDEAHPERHFFWARDLNALPFLDGLDKCCGLMKGTVGTGVEPCESAVDELNVKAARFRRLILYPN